MAMILEDGTGLANSNSYAASATLLNYAADRGYTIAAGDVEAALVRATQWLDNTYRAKFQGWRLKFRKQSLEWPRAGVADTSGFIVDYASVPIEIVRATCEGAIRELASPGSLAPDLEAGGRIRSVRAGDTQIDYGSSGGSAQAVFQTIDGLLGTLIVGPTYSARAARV